MHAFTGVGSTKRTLARELQLAFGAVRCPVCGEEEPVERLTKHHIHPRSLGGPTDLRNLVLICRQCHDDVHHFPSAFWARAALEAFLNCRGVEYPFPPPPDPAPPEENLRIFLVRASVRTERDRRWHERCLNPPFNPYWLVGRHFTGARDALRVPGAEA